MQIMSLSKKIYFSYMHIILEEENPKNARLPPVHCSELFFFLEHGRKLACSGLHRANLSHLDHFYPLARKALFAQEQAIF